MRAPFFHAIIPLVDLRPVQPGFNSWRTEAGLFQKGGRMRLLLATDEHFAIGLNGKMLFRIPEDQKRFNELTLRNIVMMGRKTLESLPGGKPLADRMNIVVSSRNLPEGENLRLVHSPQEVQGLIDQLDPQHKKEVFVIGGGRLAASMINDIDQADLTMVHQVFPQADAWIPDLRADPSFELVAESSPQVYQDLTFTYQTYRRKS